MPKNLNFKFWHWFAGHPTHHTYISHTRVYNTHSGRVPDLTTHIYHIHACTTLTVDVSQTSPHIYITHTRLQHSQWMCPRPHH